MTQLKARKRFYVPILLAVIFGYVSAAVSEDVDVYHVYKICPAFVIYTDMFLGDADGKAKGPVALIRSSYREDDEVLEHELMHIKQAYRYGFQHWIFMIHSDDLLIRMESEAYAMHIPKKDDIPFWAEMIRDEYSPNFPVKQIEGYLSYYWEKQHSM